MPPLYKGRLSLQLKIKPNIHIAKFLEETQLGNSEHSKMEDGVPEIKDMILSEEREKKDEREGGCDLDSGGAGVISNFISSIVSKNGDDDEEIKGGGDEEKEKGGGIFNNLISGILHHDDGKHEGNDAAEGGGGGGGLIDNLVSHLPSPLADHDAAPASDEASILISIIHD